ncbi:kelch-like protein 18 [Panonychus citri]|uniref:kelch-like protein 18 n=1 Tax=Panonychus citri TaxID=50023 RepID=UPI0023074852|nr:kelch-like protein 18 [Panonychus citri]
MSDHLSGKLVYHNNWCDNLLSELLTSKSHTDVTIRIGDQSIEAHRCILAATIPFFSAMFNSNLDDSCSDIVTIKSEDIEPDIFQLIISYVYSQEIIIDPKNADLILIAANFLGIESLVIICCDYLRRHLDIETVVRSKYLGEMVNCDELIKDSDQFIISNLISVSQTLPFLQLPYISLCDFIEMISSDIRRQSILFQVILRWVNYDLESRKVQFTSLLNKISISFMRPEILMAKVHEYRTLFDSKESVDFVLDALIFQMLPDQRDDLMVKKLLHDENSVDGKIIQKTIYILDNNGFMETLNPNSDEWESFKLTSHRDMNAHVTLHGQLYLIGGFEMSRITNTVEVFNPRTKELSRCQPMHISRYATSACVYKGRIFVLGGSTTKQTTSSSVEIYDPVQNKWIVSSSMELSRCDHNAVTIKNRIYVLGGAHQEYSQVIGDVEMLNPDNGTWTLVGNLNCPRRCFGSTVINDLIYIFGGTDGSTCLKTVEVYDPIKDKSDFMPSMSCERVSPLVVQHQSKVWVIGGSRGGESLRTTEIFDLVTKQWTSGPQLDRPAARTIGGILDFTD